MTYTWTVEPISPLNPNYDPPQPWSCQGGPAYRSPGCDGVVIGKVGAYPVCRVCGPIAVEQMNAERARIEALMNTPEMRAEAAREQAWEARVS